MPGQGCPTHAGRVVVRLSYTLLATHGILAGMVLLMTSLGGLSIDRMETSLRRSDASHEVHTAMLNMQVRIQILWEEAGRVAHERDARTHWRATERRNELEADYARLTALIRAETPRFEPDERQELRLLRSVHQGTERLITATTALAGASRGEPVQATEDELVQAVLRALANREVQAQMGKLIRGERLQVYAARDRIERLFERIQFWSYIAAAAAILALLLSIAYVYRNMIGTLKALRSGAAAMLTGNRVPEFAVEGPAELRDLAHSFRAMAEHVSRRESSLSGHNDRLETAVSERTAELERLVRELRLHESRRTRLLADVSHELRTPLTIIRGETDVALLDGSTIGAEHRQTLESIRSTAQHCARLVDDLLFIARQEGGALVLQVESVDIGDLIIHSLEQCRPLAERCGCTLDTHLADGAHTVQADPQRIRQLLIILVDNAIRYGGRHIHLALSADPLGCTISVSDDGPGMNATEIEHAFERFYRGSSAAARYDEGTGLGLPVARAIVDAHGGHIALSSTPGHGLTATFSLHAVPPGTDR